uniref:Protein kinase domain-containing protein n=1 Tax=Aegilops tauschii subsp. strangulata TaxID=200361 RepID=A0A453P3U3_AEGTS
MLYRAAMRSGETAVRPACAVGADEAAAAARRIGAVTHPNLVPLRAVYVGPRGEKLLVHPFYAAGSLHRFLQGVQGAGAGQDEGRHQGERRLQPRGGAAGDARAQGAGRRRGPRAELPRHLLAGVLQEPGAREEDLRRDQLGPRQAEQEVREREEAERLLRAGHGLLQPFAVAEAQHQGDTQKA